MTGLVTPSPMELSLRQLREETRGSGRYTRAFEKAVWDGRSTAAIVCDMWDRHWCAAATARVAEMAPRMNQVLTALRRRGVFLIHAPSETMAFYADHPARRLARVAPAASAASRATGPERPTEPPLPIDDSDGGCPEEPQCAQGRPWTRQIASLDIEEGDAIDDSEAILSLLKTRGIRNVLLMGVHANMCILRRPFGIRSLVSRGFHVALVRDLTDSMYNPRRPPQVDHFTGTDLVIWHIEKHWCPTVTSDQLLPDGPSDPFRFAADTRGEHPEYREIVRLPEADYHARKVSSYVERTPHPDYPQAPQSSREAFRDMKFGVRIHWGLYSLWNLNGESWPFLKMSDAKKAEYQDLIRRFDPKAFDADGWMKLFRRAGIRCFAFTTKHHEGFSLFDTKTRVRRRVDWTASGGPRIVDCDTAFSVMESPMGRDVVKELCDAARRHGIAIDLYFSHPDWFDADFRPYNYHPLTVPEAGQLLPPGETEECGQRGDRPQIMAPAVSGEEERRMLARHRAQLIELLSNYGKLDMMCLDQWMGPRVWPPMRETMKILRSLQPEIMFRCRGVGNYGDYYTPEGFVPGAKENTEMPWMVIYPLARSFSYDPEAGNYKGGAWIVRNLADAVSKGGNFMVGIGPDADGLFHPCAVADLEDAGAWLDVNGEAIYSTRPRPGDLWREGDVRFTRSRDGNTVYAICLSWPGDVLRLATVRPVEGSTIHLLGRRNRLPWTWTTGGGLTVEIPATLRDPSRRPCRHAWTFRIETAGGNWA